MSTARSIIGFDSVAELMKWEPILPDGFAEQRVSPIVT